MFPMWLSWACIHLFNHTSTIIMLYGTRVAKAFQLQKLPNLVARIVTYYSYCKKFELWCKISSSVGLVKPVFHFTISLAASEIFPQTNYGKLGSVIVNSSSLPNSLFLLILSNLLCGLSKPIFAAITPHVNKLANYTRHPWKADFILSVLR